VFVHVTNSQEVVSIDPKQVEAVVTCILSAKQVACDEVSIHCVSKEDISKLHEEYFDDPSPTDCITFPIDDAEDDSFYKVLGEVFICPEVALTYSQTHALDVQEELTLYVVHGILHLLGFNDIEEEDKKLMRAEEFSCMELLKEKGCILSLHAPSYL
jgi:probable rRNA maturation factor